PVKTTLAPSATNSSAVRAPMPLVPPVMMATLPSTIPMRHPFAGAACSARGASAPERLGSLARAPLTSTGLLHRSGQQQHLKAGDPGPLGLARRIGSEMKKAARPLGAGKSHEHDGVGLEPPLEHVGFDPPESKTAPRTRHRRCRERR